MAGVISQSDIDILGQSGAENARPAWMRVSASVCSKLCLLAAAGGRLDSHPGERLHQLAQARARILCHRSELNAHALARLPIADYGPGPDIASRNLKDELDHVSDGRRILGGDEEATQS